jgi:hypothetical protein
MAAGTTTTEQHALLPVGGLRGRIALRSVGPSLFAVVNGILFVLVRPDVNDLWAARARASAVDHGVGLTYWFSWFGGGTTPGNYSVVTPYLCALLGTEVVGALAAVAATILATLAVRRTNHPLPAAWAAAVAAGINLWSGRIPFLLGSVAAVGAVIAVRHQRRAAAIVVTLLSILASPVSGAFICMGLSGTFLTTRTRQYRPIIAWTVGSALLGLLGVAVLFSTPGPEPFSMWMFIEVVAGLLWLWWAWPADHVRVTMAWSVLVCLALFVIPNGMGSNFARFVFFCLPAVVLATSSRRLRVALLGVVPALLMGLQGTVVDLVNAARPISSVGYYHSLAARLDKISDLRNYRVEVVNHGAHAGYDALLQHALLARGWETQEDVALNSSLQQDPLDPVTYKVWLDNNAVGYVALPASSVGGYPEYTLVQKHRAGYLHQIWSNDDWELFRVADATPIVGRPGSVTTHDQKSMTIRVPCRCTIPVRVRWSKFLTATLQAPGLRHGKTVDARPKVTAKVGDDGSGWTTLTTTQPGVYVLRGSFRGGLLR